MIENARVKGRESNSFGRQEREFFERKETDGKRILIYAGYCFLFNDQDVCITMYGVPKWFEKTHYQGKKMIRNPRRYYKKYPDIADYYDYAV